MAGKTTIEWTAMPGYVGAVWNPTTGCTRVSAGCDNCYAFKLHDHRYKVNADAAMAEYRAGRGTIPYKPAGARAAGVEMPFPKQYDLPFSHVQLLEARLDVPLRTRKPTCYFVDSMADLFHEDVPDEYIGQVFNVMRVAKQHRFLVLTKRPERMSRWTREWGLAPMGSPLREKITTSPWTNAPAQNVWLGTSVEDQASFNERVPHLRATPAALRFLSIEPLLGPLDVQYSDWKGEWVIEPSPIQWVIVGGESGPRARPFDLTWARSIRAQCQAAGVSLFVKQLGSKPVVDGVSYSMLSGQKLEAHGRDMAQWPEDLRIRTWPQ